MADMSNIIDNLTEEIRIAARWAGEAIEAGISDVENYVLNDTDEDFWELVGEGDADALIELDRMADRVADIRYRAISDASKAFRDEGFDVYDSDLESVFHDDLETLAWENDWDGLVDAVRNY